MTQECNVGIDSSFKGSPFESQSNIVELWRPNNTLT